MVTKKEAKVQNNVNIAFLILIRLFQNQTNKSNSES